MAGQLISWPRNFLVLLLAFNLMGPLPLGAQDSQTTGEPFTINGTVSDAVSGQPLQYAAVGIPELGEWILSEADGTFDLNFPEPGVFNLMVVRRGYYLATQPLNFAGPNELNVELHPEQADQPEGPGRLVGRVREKESGDPISRAKVKVFPTDQETNTDSRGRFIISGISAGAIVLEVESKGQTALTDTLVTFPGVTLAVDMGVPERAGEDPDISVEVWPQYLESVGFYRRAEQGRGHRFGSVYIQEQNANKLSDIFLGIPGFRAGFGPMGKRVITIRDTFGSGRCALGVYLDGSRMPGFDLDTYPVDWIEALEVYEGIEVPYEFNHSCGVVLLWSSGRG
jgi:hypothetical protein